MPTRRHLLHHTAVLASLLAATGLFPAGAFAFSKDAFDAKNLQDALKALGAGVLTESKDVVLKGPDIAENGTMVPLAISTPLAGVRQMLILVEKNPAALVALFHISESVEPDFSTRVKMSQSSDVYGVALMTDGRALFARKEIRVTLGGCGV